MARIMLVEDDETLQVTIRYNLERAGHDVIVLSDGEAALERAPALRSDLVILDVMLPGLDGFEVCRRLREQSTVPILILTARDDEIDRVLGLELGADDYLTKPFSMRELLARVKALLRRRELLARELRSEPATGDVLTVGPLRIDLAQRRVWRGTQEITLKPREFDLLVYLARHRERVCRSEEILRAVWGYETFGDHRTLAVHVHGLREKLEDDPRQPRLIETVRGVGYRLTVRHVQAMAR
ncbi:response regulator transcription factor [Thermomicrobium sp. 4228-Ro]|uniref:response regulator transcription factor n=1 Tax=Thermomicrobium sp. 4228-Ro TaxID=2993937 RepID=UPI002248B4B4|nr:response regulator transcription factor [Thermomicrobium sp. 4228-Ro]MCX2727131.1 response regulator transcription factor [Thermomicrobium sp. 4228-Ro]